MKLERRAGLLAHITMLPGPYGCGTLGRKAREFAHRLVEGGFTWWQVLPLSHPDAGNSPYTAFSAFAMNPLLADPGLLREDGLLTPEEEAEGRWHGQVYKVDFDNVIKMRNHTLAQAFYHAKCDAGVMSKVRWFAETEAAWLPDYALYMALCEKYQNTSWAQWPRPVALREPEALEAERKELSDRILYWEFVQWVLFDQWRRLREYAASIGVKFIGDMPYCVSGNSSDVWANSGLFQLEEGKPTRVAGVPPDFYSEDGQLWGNPLFDWDKMEEDGYSWWLLRIGKALEMYDVVRIDHFRGFSAYWSIPAGEKTAKNGRWEKGPGMKLFSLVEQKFPGAAIIAEDLGVLDDDVYKLVEDTGYPGMKLLQCGFDNGTNHHLPHNYKNSNLVVYTGTHDNYTFLGYMFDGASPEEREFVCRYLGISGWDWTRGGYHSPLIRAAARVLWESVAVLAILPFQDVAGWGNDTRFNCPGIPDGNWAVRFTDENLASVDWGWFRKLSEDTWRVYLPAEEELKKPNILS